MPHKPCPNINSGTRNGYYHADGILSNASSENRIQATLGVNKSSKDWIYGTNQDAFVLKEEIINGKKVKSRIRIPDVVVQSKELATGRSKNIFNRDHQLIWSASNPDGQTASQVNCELKRIEKETY
jgi:hypothetical protein